ncbi:uncharacterized protein [Rutidosis leptorrhynchoides]|uniref:uncharacterized protein n=1 Tax=Rutidosis leptorrhynchoides TaxID=125765 RepID=UPI003A99E17C
MICIDKSKYMEHLDNEYSYNLQLNCVRSYCRAKLKSNPKNVIGLVAMGGKMKTFEPTSDLDIIFRQLKYYLGARYVIGGELNFMSALISCGFELSNYPDDKYLKRIIFFLGGYVFVVCYA